MRNATILLFLLVILPSLVFAVSNAKLNGQKEITITQLPIDIVFNRQFRHGQSRISGTLGYLQARNALPEH